ncbi:hypothetical protein O181_009572 [Austropuccinia psidii MF-1]|uniref:TRP C-terminal domain-containing protein n=1 Tax=Austropuccinia psidii MF-1 TaxID=1389203 RepID=A0A9Q3GKF5_9BASI|nr:hypothetical protein [Austropuccinia psidii MF-1]
MPNTAPIQDSDTRIQSSPRTQSLDALDPHIHPLPSLDPIPSNTIEYHRIPHLIIYHITSCHQDDPSQLDKQPNSKSHASTNQLPHHSFRASHLPPIIQSSSIPQNLNPSSPSNVKKVSLSSSKSKTQPKSPQSNFNFSNVQLALLSLLAIQSIAVISILATTVAKIEKEIQFKNPQLKTISTYLAIFIIANVFLILMTIDLLLQRNVLQLVALCIFNITMAIYGAVLPSQIHRALQNPGGIVSWNGAREGTSCNMYLSCYGVQYLFDDVKVSIIAIPVITGIVSGLMGYLTWLIYKEFGWETFKLMGADLTLKRILHRQYLFNMFQKFVIFFIIGFSLQFLILSSGLSVFERVLTICAIPISLAVCILGGIAVSREIRWLMGIYYAFLAGALVYYAYKLVKLWDNPSISAAAKSLTLFSVLTIALLLATGIVSGLCYRNFGKGLLDAPAAVNTSYWVRFWDEIVLKESAKKPSQRKKTPRRMSLGEDHIRTAQADRIEMGKNATTRFTSSNLLDTATNSILESPKQDRLALD